MKFGELVRSHDWEAVEPVFRRIHGDKDIDAHALAYEQMRFMQPLPSTVELTLEKNVEDDGDVWVHVSGFGKDGIRYAIGFSAWAEYLGMEISADTVAKFPPLEIIVYALWEMTFYGYDEVSIKKVIDDIKDTRDEMLEEYKDLDDKGTA